MLRSLCRPLLLLLGLIAQGIAADPIADGGDLAPAYRNLVRDAMRSFTSRDFATASALVTKADQMYPPSANTVNIRAAIAIEQGHFAEGREYCMKALNLDPSFFPALFNLAEIPFMQGKYSEARLAYEKLLDQKPAEDLIRFRIFLTYLLEKDETNSREELDRMPLLNDTPIYFFAHAAWEFAHSREKEAMSFLRSATAVFPPGKIMNFVDVFYDLGWLKRDTAPMPK